jgi:FixJ family two-component response regulator
MEKTCGEGVVSIIDDDRGIRLALAALMRSVGLAAEAFATAEEFLESSTMDQTACLVLDVHLPKMSGLELQQLLTGDGRRVPTIFITAHECERARALALQYGAAAFLSKPLSGGVLLACVRAAMKLSSL